MLAEGLDRGEDPCPVCREHGPTSGPGAVALGHEPSIGADLADRHAAVAEVPDEVDPLRVANAVTTMATRGVTLHQRDESHPFVISEGVLRDPGGVSEIGDGHAWKLPLEAVGREQRRPAKRPPTRMPMGR